MRYHEHIAPDEIKRDAQNREGNAREQGRRSRRRRMDCARSTNLERCAERGQAFAEAGVPCMMAMIMPASAPPAI